MGITYSGKVYQSSSIGFILALLVLILCVVLWAIGKGTGLELALIAALALAYLVG